jgi:hypothetical protein
MKVSMSPYELKELHLEYHPDSHFFDYDTLKFFGESMSTMKVLKETEDIRDSMGELHTCYVLSKLSRKYPTGPRRTYAYFDVDTLDYIMD